MPAHDIGERRAQLCDIKRAIDPNGAMRAEGAAGAVALQQPKVPLLRGWFEPLDQFFLHVHIPCAVVVRTKTPSEAIRLVRLPGIASEVRFPRVFLLLRFLILRQRLDA